MEHIIHTREAPLIGSQVIMQIIKLQLYYYNMATDKRHRIQFPIKPSESYQQMLLTIGRKLVQIKPKTAYYYVVGVVRRDDGELAYRVVLRKVVLFTRCKTKACFKYGDWVSVAHKHKGKRKGRKYYVR